MGRITRTYLTGCNWCGATGQRFPMQHDGTSFSSLCPVCNGNKTILVTEVEEPLVEVSTKELLSMHDRLKIDVEGAGKIFLKQMEKIGLEPNWDDTSRMKEYRKMFNLSLRDLSKLSGISISTLSRMERKGNHMFRSYLGVRSTFMKLWKEQDMQDKK